MGAKVLRSYVHVAQDDGSVNVYGPGDDIPAADKAKIGDHCWVDDDEQGDGPADGTPSVAHTSARSRRKS